MEETARNKCYRTRSDLARRRVLEETVVVQLSRRTVYGLDEQAAWVLRALEHPRTVSELREGLSVDDVYAPAAARRDEIVPGRGDDGSETRRCSSKSAKPPGNRANEQRMRPERMSWADLIRRVLERWTNCTLRPRSARSLLHHSSVSSAA